MNAPFDDEADFHAEGPLAPRPSAATRVYEALRRQIISLELPPGATLSRAKLAKLHEVSQGPVREAIKLLEQDGLVDVYPQSRTMVAKIDLALLYEVHFLRLAVECEVVRRSARSITPAALAKLRAILKVQQTLVGDLAQSALFNETDEAFHQTLFAAVGQLNLHRTLKAKAGHLARARRLELPRAGKMREILESHRKILAAIEAGDPLGAQEAVRVHLTGTVSRIDTLRQENPGFFMPAP